MMTRNNQAEQPLLLVLLLLRTAPTSSSCPFAPAAPGKQPAGLKLRVGAGMLADSALRASEVVWVGPECLNVFVGSPSLVQLEDGGWLASHDLFGDYWPRDTVHILRSPSGASPTGVAWQPLSNVTGLYWANLFEHRGALYLLGVDGDDVHKVSPPHTTAMKGGPVAISQSTDGGVHWSKPVTLINGSFQTAPTPVIEHDGVLYRTMEDSAAGGCGALVLWAAAGSNLLSPASWSRSNALVAEDFRKGAGTWQEGSVVVAPSGEVWNLLRVNGQTTEWNNKAAATVLDRASGKLTFKQWVDGPFSNSKFAVRRDPASPTPVYYALSTNVTDTNIALARRNVSWAIGARNNLVWSRSLDLVSWEVCTTVLADDTGLAPAASAEYTGFQYPDWRFDGKDVVALVRTAYRGAPGAGRSNRVTSVRIVDYAGICGADWGSRGLESR